MTPLAAGVRRLARRPYPAILLPALLALLLAALPTLLAGRPPPRIHDEWSYLLAADTFAEGRLTNPPHPLWRHFETIHVLQQPTYQSMYPPAQGLVLALGQVLWHPALGVWLSVAGLVAAMGWMLRGWLPAHWAFLGALLVALQLVLPGRPYSGGSLGYWSQSYWGGAVAATGGALVFGALPRIWRRPRLGAGVCLGLGLAVLAGSRPLEGLLTILPAILLTLVWLLRQRGSALRAALVRGVLPVVFLGAATLGALGLYNFRVTGNPFTMPWQLHYQEYCVFPLFVWQEPRPALPWRHPQMAAFHGERELQLHRRHRTVGGFLETSGRKLARLGIFYLGPVLFLSLLPLPWLWRRRRLRLAFLTCLLVLGLEMVSFAAYPHYFAPATAPLFVLLVEGLRHLRLLRLGRHRLGRGAVPLILVGVSALALLCLSRVVEERRQHRREPRIRLQARLESLPGRHLVVVRYPPGHPVSDEWINNRARIDEAKVVYAREMSPEENHELREYFGDRRQWLLTFPEGGGPRLEPYR